jgi:hypothetical protein
MAEYGLESGSGVAKVALFHQLQQLALKREARVAISG